MAIENKKYRDTVFRMLFNNKEHLLELYNALNGTSYSDPNALTIKTLKGNTSLELVVNAYNVNEGHNTKIMEACNTLKGYSLFVSKVRKYIKEVITMSLYECTTEEVMQVLSEEQYEIGQQEINDLYAWLFANGRGADVQRAVTDKAYREKLKKDFKGAQ